MRNDVTSSPAEAHDHDASFHRHDEIMMDPPAIMTHHFIPQVEGRKNRELADSLSRKKGE